VRKVKQAPRREWEGKGTKADKGRQIVGPCGCVFRCDPWFWGSRVKTIEKGDWSRGSMKKREPTGYFWFRIKDCEKHKKMQLDALRASCNRVEGERKSNVRKV